MRLTKAIGLGTATALATLLAAAPTASASVAGPGDDSDDWHHGIIHLDAHQTSETVIPFEQHGHLAPGTRNVFTDDLFDEHGHWVGHDGGTCLITSFERGGEAQCVVTLHLEDHGQITVQGLVEDYLQTEHRDYFLAITGGTEEFDRVHGQLHVQRDGSPEHTELTLDLD